VKQLAQESTKPDDAYLWQIDSTKSHQMDAPRSCLSSYKEERKKKKDTFCFFNI